VCVCVYISNKITIC